MYCSFRLIWGQDKIQTNPGSSRPFEDLTFYKEIKSNMGKKYLIINILTGSNMNIFCWSMFYACVCEKKKKKENSTILFLK